VQRRNINILPFSQSYSYRCVKQVVSLYRGTTGGDGVDAATRGSTKGAVIGR